MAPHVARSSAAMVLTTKDKQVLVYHLPILLALCEEKPPVTVLDSHHKEPVILKTFPASAQNKLFIFPQRNSTWKGLTMQNEILDM